MKRKPLLAAVLLSSALLLSGTTVLAEDQVGDGAIIEGYNDAAAQDAAADAAPAQESDSPDAAVTVSEENVDGIYYASSFRELQSLEIKGGEAVWTDRYFEQTRSTISMDDDGANVSMENHEHPLLEITSVNFQISQGADGSLTGDPDTITVSVSADEQSMATWMEDWGVSDQESLKAVIRDKFVTVFCQRPITISDYGILEVYYDENDPLGFIKPMDDPSALNGTYVCEDNSQWTLTLEDGICTYDNGAEKSELPYAAFDGADYGGDGYLLYITDFEKFMGTDLYEDSEEYMGEIEGSDPNHIEFLADQDWYREGFEPDNEKEEQDTTPETDSAAESYTVTLSGADGSDAHSEVEGVQYSLLAKTGTKTGTYQAGETVDLDITDSYDIGYVIYLNDDTSNPIEGYGSGTVSFTMPANDVYVSVNYYSG